MDNDRSLSSGLSIPQWMKTRMIDTRLDLDQNALSPPDHDDHFFIRYPRKKSRDERNAQNSIIRDAKEAPNLTQHTIPCRQYLHDTPAAIAKPPIKQHKSSGTDDGFKGVGAACGTSIVKVAHQMVSQKRFELQQQDGSTIDYPDGFNPSIRRGSKSLPTSPLSSPKLNRKLLPNQQHKYFTGTFVEPEKNTGWLLSSLLGKRDTISSSVSTVSEESGSMIDLTSVTDDDMQTVKKPQVFKAKPSELREMNFWSPTSM